MTRSLEALLKEKDEIIASLNERLIERTQGMLAKQVEYLDRARKAETQLERYTQNGRIYEKEGVEVFSSNKKNCSCNFQLKAKHCERSGGSCICKTGSA